MDKSRSEDERENEQQRGLDVVGRRALQTAEGTLPGTVFEMEASDER